MSLKSWKEEFCPVDAEEVPEEDALAHSLRKWEGLLPENLTKHGLMVGRELLMPVIETGDEDDDRFFTISASTCALCKHYFSSGEFGGRACQFCPLAEARKGLSCDKGRRDPYGAFLKTGDPKPMIRLLKKAIKATRD